MRPGILIDQLRLNWKRPAPEIMRRWPPATRIIELPHALIRARVVGSGNRTILFTPDSPAVIENYGALIDLLAPHARVVCFEFPGCGFSYPRFGFGFTLADYVAVTKGVMDALAIERATLAFTCVNALVAMAFARLHADRVDNLVLSQVASVPEMHAFVRRIDIRAGGISMTRTPVIGQLFMAHQRVKFAHIWFKIALPRGFSVDSIWKVAKPAYDDGCEFCLASLVQGQSAIVPQDVAIGSRPATIFWGDADRTHFKTRKESICELAPAAVIRHLPDRGHCPDIEAPEEFCRLLLAAL